MNMRITRFFFASVIAFVLHSFSLFANEYSKGDIFKKDGISYKVLVTYLVVDSKETTDTIQGPDKFYRSGELMVVGVDKSLSDVVIPPAVGRFKVIGLTDSLFYQHEHDRIWLPKLQFAGNGCFAKLKVRSGALVIHDISNFGLGVFDELDADLIFDITRKITWGNAFSKMLPDSSFTSSMPKGLIKTNTRMLGFIRNSRVYDDCYGATANNYKKWIDKAFNNDEKFQQNDLNNKTERFNRRTYSTTPRKRKNGFTITASAVDVKGMGYPWGKLTSSYYRRSNYAVLDKKSKKTIHYQDFIPLADPVQKMGWYVKFVSNEEEVKYMLNGKLIKK